MAQFKITKDRIDDGKMNGRQTEKFNPEKAIYPFRLRDDDGIVYFEGLCSSDSSFAPLDQFGSAYGCVDIQYRENGVWTSL